jgi:hypothetical protein
MMLVVIRRAGGIVDKRWTGAPAVVYSPLSSGRLENIEG